MNRKLLTIAIVSAAALILLAACSGGFSLGGAATPTAVAPVAETGGINVEGRVMPKAYVSLAFPVGGEISALPQAEGSQLEAGALVASLGKREPVQAALSAAKLEVLAAQQALNDLNRKGDLARAQSAQALQTAARASIDAEQAYSEFEKDAYTNTLDDKEKALQTAKDKLKDANDVLDKNLNLDKDNETRKSAQKVVDDAQIEYDTAIRERDLWKLDRELAAVKRDLAKAALADAQRDFDQRKGGPDADALALATARLDNANVMVQSAERTLANMDLTAPFAGTLTDLNGSVVGQWSPVGRTVATIADFSEWYVETKDLTELEVVDVFEGQAVEVIADAIKDQTFSGTVTAVKKGYTERSGDVLYTVRIKLDQGAELLRWGMTVQVLFKK